MASGVRKGQDWGEPGSLPPGAPIAHSNTELRSLVETAWRAGQPLPIIGLVGGDLAATLGSPGREDRLTSDQAQRLQIDIGLVVLDGADEFCFLSHLVARRRWWHGRVMVVANAAWMGEWNIAPRAHPGDGRLDLFDATLPFAERLKARKRLGHGGHVPHPQIAMRRVRHHEETFDRALDIHLDGDMVGRAHTIAVTVQAAHLTVVV